MLPLIAVVVAPGDDDPPGLEPLAGAATVVVVRTAAELDAVIGEADALAVYDIGTPLVAALGDRVAHLSWVHAASAGTDAARTPAVAAAGIPVTNARGVFDRPIAEWVLAVLLLFAKGLRTTIDQQRAHRWAHHESEPLAGRRVLVVGAGSIGSAVARLLAAAGMEVAGIARRPRCDPGPFARVLGAGSLHAELGRADDVVVCAPLTDATRGLFDAGAFAAMRPGARFVNVGRGAIVDEAALLAALDAGTVGAAALDVVAEEPLPPGSPLWSHERVLVSPHCSGDEVGWRQVLGEQLVELFGRWRRGEPLPVVVA